MPHKQCSHVYLICCRLYQYFPPLDLKESVQHALLIPCELSQYCFPRTCTLLQMTKPMEA